MNAADKLEEGRTETSCRNLVLRAAALADGGRASDLAALFTPDAVLVRPPGEVLSYVLLWTGSTQSEAGRWGRAAQGPLVVGEFDDRFTRTQDGWRIAHREARFLLHADH